MYFNHCTERTVRRHLQCLATNHANNGKGAKFGTNEADIM